MIVLTHCPTCDDDTPQTTTFDGPHCLLCGHSGAPARGASPWQGIIGLLLMLFAARLLIMVLFS